MTLLIDSDFVCFEAASLAEKRSVVVTHKQSGRQKEFDTRTEFWGHWKTKSGGWLAEQNKQRSAFIFFGRNRISNAQNFAIEMVFH